MDRDNAGNRDSRFVRYTNTGKPELSVANDGTGASPVSGEIAGQELLPASESREGAAGPVRFPRLPLELTHRPAAKRTGNTVRRPSERVSPHASVRDQNKQTVFRSIDTQASEVTPDTAGTGAQPVAAASPATGMNGSPPVIDTKKVADKVYLMMRRDLVLESERAARPGG